MRAFSTEPRADDEKETGRLEAFSDGVFAVAITLLILDINPLARVEGTPLPGDAELWRIIVQQLPRVSAFIISFFTIGIMWLNHHKIFKHIRRTDTGLLLLNILLLMIIVVIPVPTGLLADYLFNTSQHVAAILYSATFFLMAIAFNLVWRYASYKNRLLAKNANLKEVEAISRQYLFGPLFYLVPLVFAFINTPICALLQFLLALFFALPGRPVRSVPQSEEVVAEEQ